MYGLNSYYNSYRQTSPEILDAIKNNNITGVQKYIARNDIKKDSLFSTSKYSTYLNDTDRILSDRNLNPLHIAAIYDSLEVFVYLQNKLEIDILVQSSDQYNPLHYACFYNSFEVASYIMSCKPDEAKKVYDSLKYQYIYLAVTGQSLKILKELFNKGADLALRPNKENNPIDTAIKKKNIEILKLLLEHSPHSYTKGVNGDTAIIQAIKNSHEDAVPLLIENNVNPAAVNSAGYTALFVNLYFYKSLEVTKILCNALDSADIDISYKTKHAVHYVCHCGDPQIAKIVLDKGIDVNRFDEQGEVGPKELIDISKTKDAIKILEMLVEKGFQLDLRKDETHNTLLGHYLASIMPYPEIVDWLIGHGADVNLPFIGKDKKNMTIKDKLLQKKAYAQVCKKYNITGKKK